MFLYYNRNRHEIYFENVGTKIHTMSDVMFEQPLNEAFFDSRMASYTGKMEEWEFTDANGNKVKLWIPIPNTPAGEEEGSVVFAGWYTTPLCVDGTEFNFANAGTMPDAEMTLFAKWEPTYWDITVYQEKPTAENPNPKVLLEKNDILFGTLPTGWEPEHESPGTGYIFAGWYYEEDGQEKRFDFNTMPIKQDLVIYAKWTSRVPVPYTVYYVVEKADGPLVIDGKHYEEIAERTTGVSLAGIGKTFVPKVGAELYTAYQKSYFPHTCSHLIKMSAEEKNEFAFVYSTPTSVDYKVVHTFVDDGLIDIIGTNKLVMTFNHTIQAKGQAAFVTLDFRNGVTKENLVAATEKTLTDAQKTNLWTVITNLSPDIFQQDLILSTNAEENVANFHWEKKDVCVYQVIHKFQSVDGTDYIAELPMMFSGSAGQSVTVSCVERYGFKCVGADKQTEKLTATIFKDGAWQGGVVFVFEYDRVNYNYTVHYRSGMDTIADPVQYSAPFGTVVKYSDVAKTIDGYSLANGDSTVEISQEGQEIICYYQPLDVYYRYQSSTGGMMTPDSSDTKVGKKPEASTLTMESGYMLQRWFYTVSGSNEEIPVPDEWLSNDGMTVSPTVAPPEWASKTITICAELVPTSLTIQSTIAATPANAWVTENQGFLYRITGDGVNFTVAVPEGESVTILGLPGGVYTITAQSSWSWRYDKEEENTRTVTISGNHTVEFFYERPDADKDDKYYLTDEAFAITKLS